MRDDAPETWYFVKIYDPKTSDYPEVIDLLDCVAEQISSAYPKITVEEKEVRARWEIAERNNDSSVIWLRLDSIYNEYYTVVYIRRALEHVMSRLDDLYPETARMLCLHYQITRQHTWVDPDMFEDHILLK